MNDFFRLLFWGACAAALAGGLWAWLGEYMFIVLNAMVFAALLVENRQLRKRLRVAESTPSSPTLDENRFAHGPEES